MSSQKTDSPQTQPENSLFEIQIQEELEKNTLNFDSEMESAMDTSTHRVNMRNFFDSVCIKKNNDSKKMTNHDYKKNSSKNFIFYKIE